jgi:hypothetical protein
MGAEKGQTNTPLWAAALIGIAADWVSSFLLIVLSAALRLDYRGSPDVPAGIIPVAFLNAPGMLLLGVLVRGGDDGLLAGVVGSAISGALYGVIVQRLIRWRRAQRQF